MAVSWQNTSPPLAWASILELLDVVSIEVMGGLGTARRIKDVSTHAPTHCRPCVQREPDGQDQKPYLKPPRCLIIVIELYLQGTHVQGSG